MNLYSILHSVLMFHVAAFKYIVMSLILFQD